MSERDPNRDLGAEFKALLEAGLTQGDALSILHDHGDKFMDAAEQVETDDDLEVDDKPLFSEADNGVWVSAWVWVPRPEETEETEETEEEEPTDDAP